MSAARTVTRQSREEWISHYAAVKRRLNAAALPPRPILIIPETRHRMIYAEPIGPRFQDPRLIYPGPIGPMQLLTPKSVAMNIMALAAAMNGCTVDEIKSRCRNSNVMRARSQAVVGIFEACPNWSYPRIATFMGFEDHSSVIHHLRKHYGPAFRRMGQGK